MIELEEFKEKLRGYVRSIILSIRIIARRKTGLASLVILSLYVAAAIATAIGVVPPTPPAKTGWEYMFAPPSMKDFPWYILGTDYLGRPLFLVLVRGTLDILIVAVLASLITIGVGLLVGLFAGYYGGALDSVLMAITDIALNIPSYLLMLVLAALLPVEIKQNVFVIALVLSATTWAPLARAVRAQTLSLKKREFIDVARVLGFSTPRILFKEILPLMAPYIFVNWIMSLIGAVYGYTGLAFLGFIPVRPENWGVQLNLAIIAGGALYTEKAMYALWSPIAAIVLLEVSFMWLAGAAEELFNPALRAEFMGEEE